MPLAVAAAADLPRVDDADLIDLITRLNDANVPPVEFVQIIRYIPVALIDQNPRPRIVEYVTDETRRGVTGSALATSVAAELRDRYGVPRFDLTPARTAYTVTEIVPVVVSERLRTQPVRDHVVVETERAHPHGGPPGQLKKIEGLQTGAEVVHGVRPPGQVRKELRIVEREHGHGHARGHQRFIAPQPAFLPQPMYSSAPPMEKIHGNPHGGPPGNPGHDNGHGHGKGKG